MADLPAIEGFRVVEEIGAGALSTVYKAIEVSIGRAVAIKVLRSTIAPTSSFAAQLEREARVLGELCHPNIGLLHRYVRDESRMYLVLEFIDGHSLADLLKKRPTVPPDAAAMIGAFVARGLAHAHERGIVHRDIKPANVLVSNHGDVKIFDFGIASRVNPSPEDAASVDPLALGPRRVEDVSAFGTPAYMSPEQILGETVDARSDVFSLGIVLYQMLCGARPFERGDETDARPAALRIRRDPPVPLYRRAPDVPPALERIVMRAIEKLPVDRFQSAEVMAEQLADIATTRTGLRGERIVAQGLQLLGLAPGPESAAGAPPAQRTRASVRLAVAGLGALGLLAAGGGIAIEASATHDGEAAGARPLELTPGGPGFLRVLATPWAEVWVDGQRIDFTPFARSIPLLPGVHYVTLVHPSAPVEKRTLTIVRGETRTLDVVMGVGATPLVEDGGTPALHAEHAEKDAGAPALHAERGR
ncbi:MAG: serine/threonine-protein kinase [Polyangiaceae bacterium]